MSTAKRPTKHLCNHVSVTIHPETNEGIANLLVTTHLFFGTSELDRLMHKQLLFLTAVGLKPVSQVSAGHWRETSSGRVSVPDDANEVKSTLNEWSLAYHICQDRYALDILVARDPKNLQKMITSTNEYEIGRLFGYPETAVSAFKNREQDCLPLKKQAIILQQRYHDARLINLFCFRMSKQHYRTEMLTVESWFNLLKESNLLS